MTAGYDFLAGNCANLLKEVAAQIDAHAAKDKTIAELTEKLAAFEKPADKPADPP